MPDLLVAPYVPLREPDRVGPWQLIPFNSLADSAHMPDRLRDAGLRLVEAYRLPDGGARLGAVVYPAEGQVGSPFERTAMRLLRHALLAGCIADNPTMAVDEDDQLANAGHAMATSENALVYGHPLGDGQSYALEAGVLARVVALRSAEPHEPLPKVEPPVELPQPLFGNFDAEVADATHGALSTDSLPARRLHRALDWYVVAFSNAEAVSNDVRVGAVRSALEVLTGSGDESKKVVRAVGRLLKEGDTPTQMRRSVFWKEPVELTDDEWWVARLCELRNVIVHGEDIPAELWMHEAHHHLAHAHDSLIRCLKTAVSIHADDPLLKLTRSERVFPRMAQELAKELRRAESADG